MARTLLSSLMSKYLRSLREWLTRTTITEALKVRQVFLKTSTKLTNISSSLRGMTENWSPITTEWILDSLLCPFLQVASALCVIGWHQGVHEGFVLGQMRWIQVAAVTFKQTSAMRRQNWKGSLAGESLQCENRKIPFSHCKDSHLTAAKRLIRTARLDMSSNEELEESQHRRGRSALNRQRIIRKSCRRTYMIFQDIFDHLVARSDEGAASAIADGSHFRSRDSALSRRNCTEL